MSEQEYQKYLKFYQEYWTMFKKYRSPPEPGTPDEEKYWERFIEDARNLSGKHENAVFFNSIINATLDEMERVQKGRVLETRGQIIAWDDATRP